MCALRARRGDPIDGRPPDICAVASHQGLSQSQVFSWVKEAAGAAAAASAADAVAAASVAAVVASVGVEGTPVAVVAWEVVEVLLLGVRTIMAVA